MIDLGAAPCPSSTLPNSPTPPSLSTLAEPGWIYHGGIRQKVGGRNGGGETKGNKREREGYLIDGYQFFLLLLFLLVFSTYDQCHNDGHLHIGYVGETQSPTEAHSHDPPATFDQHI